MFNRCSIGYIYIYPPTIINNPQYFLNNYDHFLIKFITFPAICCLWLQATPLFRRLWHVLTSSLWGWSALGAHDFWLLTGLLNGVILQAVYPRGINTLLGTMSDLQCLSMFRSLQIDQIGIWKYMKIANLECKPGGHEVNISWINYQNLSKTECYHVYLKALANDSYSVVSRENQF